MYVYQVNIQVEGKLIIEQYWYNTYVLTQSGRDNSPSGILLSVQIQWFRRGGTTTLKNKGNIDRKTDGHGWFATKGIA
jgi:hypothetical protein